MPYSYQTDADAIYAESFATIRAEADLAHFAPEEERLVVRMIHAAGMVGLEHQIRMSPDLVAAARSAMEAGAPILCDARMVSEGITRKRLPADNQVICTLHNREVPDRAARHGTTRSAVALDLWHNLIWTARSSPSAMHQPPCFTCSKCSKVQTAPARPRSSAARWALSARLNRKQRFGTFSPPLA